MALWCPPNVADLAAFEPAGNTLFATSTCPDEVNYKEKVSGK
tara:strand:+ start:850 stop:975 length:126 start_codon:yes stop_codon:yes gene_type:complete